MQSSENVASTVLLLHSRYDLRGVYQAGSAALRLLAIVIAAPFGVTEALVAIVVAQGIATVAVSVVGLVALRRFPAAPARELAEDVPGIRSFVIESSIATGVISLRTTLVPLVLGVVSGTTQVGFFRIAQTPQTGLAAASSPARLVLMTEQTRDWEKGERTGILAGIRRYTRWAGAIMLVAVPVFFVAMPWLVDLVFGSEYDDAVDRGAHRAARRRDPLRARLDEVAARHDRPAAAADLDARARDARRDPARRGARGRVGRDRRRGRRARVDARLRRRLARRDPAPARRGRPPRTRDRGLAAAVRVVVVSGIWPPDPGGPASHAPALADFLAERATASRW